MGMYTEFILGCAFSKNTPKALTDALDYVINDTDAPEDPEVTKLLEEYDMDYLFNSCSYYFGAPCSGKFYFDELGDQYRISTRSNLKNYEDQIERFIEYITPYVDYGSGDGHDIFAYVHYEEDPFPTLYGKDGKHEWKG